jgi:hypothetical protein
MTVRQVFVAPVPGEHISSLLTVPGLASRVAFGSSKQGVETAPIGVEVYIFVSQPTHRLYRRGAVSWGGILGAIVPAVTSGRRSGKHPDAATRPPTAELNDGPFSFFWEVEGLHPLEQSIPLNIFKRLNGGAAFSGDVPQWPMLTYLDA